MNSSELIDRMLDLANQLEKSGDNEKAFGIYKQIVEMEPNITAQYNLGCMYALGKGTETNFLSAAFWFKKAYENGCEEAENIILKCTHDYMMDGAVLKTPKVLFDEMITYAEYLYPNDDAVKMANNNLFHCATYNFGKKNYSLAVKFYRAVAEFANNRDAQYNLGLFYNNGVGVEMNDLFAMYWFDKASDNGVKEAVEHRNGIFNAYYNNLSRADFIENMNILIGCCKFGSDDIPKDAKKAEFWQAMLKKYTNG